MSLNATHLKIEINRIISGLRLLNATGGSVKFNTNGGCIYQVDDKIEYLTVEQFAAKLADADFYDTRLGEPYIPTLSPEEQARAEGKARADALWDEERARLRGGGPA